jgi:hypothetical protein
VCEAVPASVAHVTKRAGGHEDLLGRQARTRRLSIVKIASFALDPDRCLARAPEFPDGERRMVRRCVSQHEDDVFRTKSHTCTFTAVFIGAPPSSARRRWRHRAPPHSPSLRQRIASYASGLRLQPSPGAYRPHRRSVVQLSGLRGDNSSPRRCPPFVAPCPSARLR